MGEDGPHALAPNLPLQRALKRCAERGLMLVTVSKNVHEDVEAAFAAHPEWPLSHSDFVLHKVSWDNKGSSVRAAAAELGVTEAASIVFVDDNPVEVAEVQARVQARARCSCRWTLPSWRRMWRSPGHSMRSA